MEVHDKVSKEKVDYILFRKIGLTKSVLLKLSQ